MSRQDNNDNCGNPNDSLTGSFEYSTQLSTKGLRLDWLQHQLMNESTPHGMHLQDILHQTIQHRASRTVSTWPLFQMGLSRTTGWMSVSLPWHTIISPVAKDKTHMGKHSILTQKLQQPRGCDWLVANKNSSRCFFLESKHRSRSWAAEKRCIDASVPKNPYNECQTRWGGLD